MASTSGTAEAAGKKHSCYESHMKAYQQKLQFKGYRDTTCALHKKYTVLKGKWRYEPRKISLLH